MQLSSKYAYPMWRASLSTTPAYAARCMLRLHLWHNRVRAASPALVTAHPYDCNSRDIRCVHIYGMYGRKHFSAGTAPKHVPGIPRCSALASSSQAQQLWERHKNEATDRVRANPYLLLSEFPSLGFKVRALGNLRRLAVRMRMSATGCTQVCVSTTRTSCHSD